MPRVKEPTISDRYLRSIALGVGAVMVGVVAYPLALVLGYLGLAADATSDATSSNAGSILCYTLAVVVALVGVTAVLALAWMSLMALSQATFEFNVVKRLSRSANSSPTPANLGGADSPPVSGSGERERVLILTESEVARLGGTAPASNEPGWYVDPLGVAGGRWWNGTGWTGRIQGAPSQATP